MKLFALGFVLLLGAYGGGCSNPNANGVQQYGTVVGRVLDATNNQPVAAALVNVGSLYVGYSGPDGAFTLTQIPIGHQVVTATAPGYDRISVPVFIKQGTTVSAGYVRIAPVTGGPTVPPPAAAATPTPLPTPVPALTPQPSPSGSPTPGAMP